MPERSASGGRRSWKQSGTVSGRGAPPESKKIGRWFLSLLLPALIGVFIWLLFRNNWGDRHLVVVPMAAIDQLTLPARPFAAEDARALREIQEVEFHEGTASAQSESSFDAFLSDAAKLPKSEREVLLVYISAHGLAENGNAYLVCSDFDRAASGGKYDVKRLLDKIATSRARFKLVVLDAGRVDYDPRLGIVGNEFASRVADSVKQLKQQDLWVMLATGGSQVSATDYANQQSVFGKAIKDALAGKANPQGGDRYVDLFELNQYVSQTCRDWFGDGLPSYQTPVLLKAGVGTEFDAAKLKGKEYRLVYLAGGKPEEKAEEKKPEEKPAEEKPAATALDQRGPTINWPPTRRLIAATTFALAQAEKGDAAQNEAPAEQTKKPDEGKGSAASPAAADDAANAPETTGQDKDKEKKATDAPADAPAKTEPADKSAPPEPKPAPLETDPAKRLLSELHTELRKLWEVRDKLRESRGVDELTPIDFAPHLWREAEAWMLHYESRIRADYVATAAVDPSASGQNWQIMLRDMTTLRANLEQLLAAIHDGTVPKPIDEKSVGYRLNEAWTSRYLTERKLEDEKFLREAPPILIETRQAVRELHRLLYFGVDYVRWFGRTNTTLADVNTNRDPIESYLAKLEATYLELEQLERSPLGATEQNRLRDFIARVREISESQKTIESLLTKIEDGALSSIRERLSHRRIEELLSTPILSASRRMRLLEQLRTLRPETAENVATSSEPRSSQSRAVDLQIKWPRAKACLSLELALMRIVDSGAATTAERSFREADLAGSRTTNDGTYPAEFWDQYRETLRVVKNFYSGLPRAADRTTALVAIDPRDAVLLNTKNFPLPTFRIELERAAELLIEPVAKVLRLDSNLETKLSVTIAATKPNLLDTRVVPQADESLFTFELLPESEELPVERGWYRKTIHWRVKATPQAVGTEKSTAPVRLAARFGTRQVESAVDISLPRPDRVDVYFSRIAVPAEAGGSSSTVRLELFPNRETRFICTLVNQNDQPKTVEVAMYAIAPRPFGPVPIGTLDENLRASVADETTRAILDAKLIAKSAKPIELPAATVNQSPVRVPVDFLDPNAAPAPPPPADGKAPATPPPPPAKPAPLPIHALVIKITDVKQKRVEPLKWIELSPLSPREYLEPTIGYDQRQQQIVATFRPKIVDERGRPRLPTGKDVEIRWDPAGADLPEQGRQLLFDVLERTAEQPQATLRADAPADDKYREVRIDVDGYPRAFLYRVACRRDQTAPPMIPGDDLARERTAIRIESLSVVNQPKVYHFPPHVKRAPAAPPPPDSKDPPIEHIDLANRQPALFNTPAQTLNVHIQADAPLDAFANSTDGIRVKLRENDDTRALRAIREMQAFYVASGPDGIVELQTQVGDLNVPLRVGSLTNVETVVDAEIKFRNTEDVSQAIVQFDGDTPILQDVKLPQTAAKDSKIVATLLADDLFGLQRVIWGFSKDGSKRLLDAAANPRNLNFQRNDTGRYTATLEIDLKDMPVGKQILLAKVVDRVGKESDIQAREFIIVEPMPVSTKGEIRGIIRAGRSSVNGNLFDLTIEGGDIGTKPVTVNPDGSFVVPDLSPGEYTLKPKGSVAGRNVKEKEFKAKPTDPKARTVITLDVSG